MRFFPLHQLLFLTFGIFVSGFSVTSAFGQEVSTVHELQRIIEAQQKQLEMQQKQLDEQRQLMQELQSQVNTLAEDSKTTVQVPAQAEGARTTPPAPVEKVVTSGGGERVKLSISGHVNRAIQVRDDGERTDTYFVDNDNSESQVRFVGTAKANEDLTLGTEIEVSIATNISGQVDQCNQETNNVFDERKVEITLESKRYGKLWLGKGYTASYTTGAVDLSKTTTISYSTIVDLAGSMLFRNSDDGTLTDVRIFNAFNSFDGLNRRNRLRYDLPKFGGFHLATTAVSNNRYEVALRWGGQGLGFKIAGAAAIADPNEDNADLQYNGSAAVLHEGTGLNLSVSFGMLDRDNQQDPQNYFAKIGWLRRFFSVGETAFSVDYTRSLNLPTERDDAYSISAAAVQQFDKFGAEVFAGYRLHSLDRDIEPDVEDIGVVSLGTRVNF